MGNHKLIQKNKVIREKDLVRRKGQKSRYVNILIVSEGLTEYHYFNDLRRCFRHKGINIILEKPRGSAPISLVEFVIEYTNKTEGVDHVFCVFDRDEHVSYHEAIETIRNYKSPIKAKSKPKFKTITSEPCFEIWILLHFAFSSKGYFKSGNKTACDKIVSDVYQYLPEYSKTMIDLFSRLQTKLPIATNNSKKLLEQNDLTGTTNPSTNVHELIDFIMDLIESA